MSKFRMYGEKIKTHLSLGVNTRPTFLHKYLPWLILGGIIGLNLLLKMWNAGAASIYLDEGASIFYCQKDAAGFQAFLAQDASPPLYYWLLRAWMGLVGDGAGALRGLSVVFSALAAGGLYAIGRRFFSEFVGVMAALLFTFSNLQFQYAQEIRCFALLGMLSVVSTYFFLGMMRDRKHLDFWGLMAANLLIAGTHYAAVPLLIAQGIVALALAPFEFKRVLRYGLSQLPMLLFALLFVWQDVSTEKLDNTAGWLVAPPAKMIMQMLSPFSGNLQLAAVMLLILAVGGGFLLWRGSRLNQRLVLILWAWPVLGLLIAWGISQWMPFFIAKYLAYLGIGWLLGVAVALDFLPIGKWGKWAVALALIGWSLFLFRSQKVVSEDWKRAAAKVQELKQDAGVIITPVYQLKTFAYYYDRTAFRNYAQLPELMQTQKILSINKLDEVFFDYQDYDRWILIQSHIGVTDPDRESSALLAKRLHRKAYFEYKGVEISLFEGRRVGNELE